MVISGNSIIPNPLSLFQAEYGKKLSFYYVVITNIKSIKQTTTKISSIHTTTCRVFCILSPTFTHKMMTSTVNSPALIGTIGNLTSCTSLGAISILMVSCSVLQIPSVSWSRTWHWNNKSHDAKILTPMD
jgi:hypothetical protein